MIFGPGTLISSLSVRKSLFMVLKVTFNYRRLLLRVARLPVEKDDFDRQLRLRRTNPLIKNEKETFQFGVLLANSTSLLLHFDCCK